MRGLSLLSLLYVAVQASRPETVEVLHIGTDGHFVRKKTGQHHAQLHHGHRSSLHVTNASSPLEGHHGDQHRGDTGKHRDTERESPQTDAQSHKAHSAVPHQAHSAVSAVRHEAHSAEQTERTPQPQGNHSESNPYMDEFQARRAKFYTWSECFPYVVIRVAVIVLIVYSFARTHVSQPLQEINEIFLKPQRLETSYPPPPSAGTPRVTQRAGADPPNSPVASSDESDSQDSDDQSASGAQPVVERLGKAIEDRLSEVEQWLQSEVTHYDISSPRVPAEPEMAEPSSKQHYQRCWAKAPGDEKSANFRCDEAPTCADPAKAEARD